MKFNDDITQSIAATVSDVLEGKATKKEEVKYPHDMYHPKTGEKEVAKTPEDHEKLAKQGYTHEKPKLDEVEQPRANGEKDFKKMHDDNVEVSGESPDGKVTKAKKGNYYKEEVELTEMTVQVSEKLKAGKGKSKADIDYIGDSSLTKKLEKKFAIKIKQTGTTTADITGDKKNILNFLSNHYYLDDDEVEELYPEILEGKKETSEESEKQAKYKKFFDAALKKFGVSSPAELEGDKKKEFFDYVDSNYDAGNEED
jgi:hypothetical protein